MAENVDFSQRYAHSEADEYVEQAERMVRDLERRSTDFKYSVYSTDPEKRKEYIEQQADALRGGDGNTRKPAKPVEEEEKPFSSDKLWNTDEYRNIIPQKL